MLIASVAEVISVGAVLPFLGALTAPEEIYKHHLMQPIIQLLQLTDPNQLLFPLTIGFIFAALFAGTIRLALLYITTRLSYATGADLSINIYRRTLYQEYAVHVNRNSSEVINGIINKTNVAINVIQAYLTLISSIILIISILAVLFSIDITVALISFVGFGTIYRMIVYYNRQQLQENSDIIAKQSTKMIKSLQEGLGGIRDVLIDGSQQFYCQLYRSSDLPLRRASGNNLFIIQSPRYAMEAAGMTLIATLAYVMSLRESGLGAAIPVLGALALGAQRLLPALQQAYGAYSTIKGSYSSFNDVIDLLNQKLPNYIDSPPPTPVVFKKEISLKNISFHYNQEQSWILKNINLTIPKNSRIGFIGVTGSGKSTLLDIVMGLLPQTEGQFTVDNQLITAENRRSWQTHIAHVPQNIYLSDSTIEENIAFGIPQSQIDREQVKKAAKQAQILELIEGWPEQYKTFVGEQGIRLSGGQRQRIGIARALYKQANVLIFDEATSALDSKTEQEVMEAIEGLGREITVLIIAHRLTTLKGCDQVVQLEKDGALHIEKYSDIVSKSSI